MPKDLLAHNDEGEDARSLVDKIMRKVVPPRFVAHADDVVIMVGWDHIGPDVPSATRRILTRIPKPDDNNTRPAETPYHEGEQFDPDDKPVA